MIWLDKTKEELAEELNELHLKKYCANQVDIWIYKKAVYDFNEMTDLSVKDRGILAGKYRILSLKYIDELAVPDGETIKYLFQTDDKQNIEAVLIKSEGKNTICVSSQVGCALDCTFCATGKQGFVRNLSVSEILSQILWINRQLKIKNDKIHSIVFMGMGEPFHNYNNVLKAIRILNDKKCFNMGARHITVSTAGDIKGIKRLADENLQIRLAVSLNTPFQKEREKIMPIAKTIGIDTLIRELKMYQDKTGRRITFEYIMFHDFNLDKEHVIEIKSLFQGLKYNMNIIKYNYVEGSSMQEPAREEIKKFQQNLKEYNISFVHRLSKGSEIQAGCGQLAGKPYQEPY